MIALSLAALSLVGGCGSGGDAAGSVQDEVCPDTLLTGDKIAFTNSLDESRVPVGSATVFPSDTAEIFCTFTLSGNLCCSDITVLWQYGGETVKFWVEDGTGLPAINAVSFVRPEGGFASGEYVVKVFISIQEVLSATFTVE
jgi:hypothetical protein